MRTPNRNILKSLLLLSCLLSLFLSLSFADSLFSRISPILPVDSDDLHGYCNSTATHLPARMDYQWLKDGTVNISGEVFFSDGISAGFSHTCGIRSSDSRVLCWGTNWNGELGDGTIVEKTNPTLTADTSAYSSIAVGAYSTCGIRSSDSRVLCWGGNWRGALGDATTSEKDIPTLTNDTSSYTSISVGSSYTCGIRSSDSRVLCWGQNNYGQLGDSTIAEKHIPTLTTDSSAYASIALGNSHTCGIRENDSRVLCWGNNDYGQLGDTSTNEHHAPTLTTETSAYLSLALGNSHTCGIRSSDSRVLCWGDNNYEQLGDGNKVERDNPTPTTDTSNYSSLTGGDSYTCGIRENDSRVLCWGANTNGQLGDGTTSAKYSSNPITDFSVYTSISAGFSHTCGIRSSDSSILCWGENEYGQVGDASTTERHTPTQSADTSSYTSISVGTYHTCGIRSSDSRVLCWGQNTYGQLGDGTNNEEDAPATTADSSSYSSIASGSSYTCGIRSSDHRVLCWGDNSFGQLGDGTIVNKLSPTLINDTSAYTSITAGSYHVCGIRSSDHRVLCWGDNENGQLGDGTNTEKLSPTLSTDSSAYASITAGAYSTCGIRENDSRVLCWGWNSYGQLGDGTTNEKHTPTPTTDTSSYSSIAAGAYHVCGIRSSDHQVLCWGSNFRGELTRDLAPKTTSDASAYSSFFQSGREYSVPTIGSSLTSVSQTWTLSCRISNDTYSSEWANSSVFIQSPGAGSCGGGKNIGCVNLNIEATNQISVYTNGTTTTDTMNFINTTIPPLGLDLYSNNSANMADGETGFTVENQGNIAVLINVTSNKNAAQFLGGSQGGGPKFKYWVEEKEIGSCADPQSSEADFVTSGGSKVCGTSGLNYADSADTIYCYVHIFVPSDAAPESKTAVLTFTSTAAS